MSSIDFHSVYEEGTVTNINTGASAFFFTSNSAQEAKAKNGSFNYLEVINDSVQSVDVILDGLTSRTRTLFGKAAIVIKPEESIFYNSVQISNSSGTSQPSNSLKVIGRIMKPINSMGV